jgi:hypothetical protein
VTELRIADEFGAHLGDGERAHAYRKTRVEPALADGEVTLDFSGVRNANSSFANALIAGLIEDRGVSVLENIVFKGCNPVLKVLVEAAIDLGIQKLPRAA